MEKIIDKIKKCLALGKSCEPNEAALAMKRARELMEKYEVSVDDIRLSGVSNSDIRMSNTKNPPRYLYALVNMISDVFGCQPVLEAAFSFRLGGYVTDVSFIGIGPNPKIAAYAFEVLERQLSCGRKQYLSKLRKNIKRSTKTRRGDLWAEAWVSAASEKAVPLSLRKADIDLITKWKNLKYNNLVTANLRQRKFNGRGDYDAVIRGIKDGRNAQLHHGMSGSGCPTLRIGQ